MLNENEIFEISLGDSKIKIRVNKDKINSSEFETLTDYEINKKFITVEKVINVDLYTKSKFKEGYSDLELPLDLKTGIKIFRK